jgi:hypothetical protein
MVDINARPRLKALWVPASAGKWRIRNNPLLVDNVKFYLVVSEDYELF